MGSNAGLWVKRYGAMKDWVIEFIVISVVVTARVPTVAHAVSGSGDAAFWMLRPAEKVCEATISLLMLSRCSVDCVISTVSHHPDLDGVRKAILTVTPNGYAEGRWIKSSAKAKL